MSVLAREPVRVYIYGLLAAIAAALVVLGVVKSEIVTTIMGIAAVILGVPVVEIARSQVSPVATTHRQ